MNIINTCKERDYKYFYDLLKSEFIEKKASIYLVNGIKMTGYITDIKLHNYVVINNNIISNQVISGEKDNKQVIFWSAIATIAQAIDNYSITYEKKLSENKEDLYFKDFINKEIKIFLCNGIKLQGNLKSYMFKEFLIIEKEGKEQLILWYSIATISPSEDIRINLKTEENKDNNILNKSINTDIVIFLKNGIKLKGNLSNCLYEDNEYLSHIVIDNNQLIIMKHVSTITINN
jgi:sRNA-binding regulator protein Hfq